jgi:hypothetical protein
MHLRQCPWLSLAALLALALPGSTPHLGAQPPGAGRPHHRSTDDILDLSQIDDATLSRRLEFSRDNLAEMRLLDILRRNKDLKGFDEKTLQKAMKLFRQNPEQFKRIAEQLKGGDLPDPKAREELTKAIEKLRPDATRLPDPSPGGATQPDKSGSQDSNPSKPDSTTAPSGGPDTPPTDDRDWDEKFFEELLTHFDEMGLLDAFKDLGLEDDVANLRDLFHSMTDGRGLPEAFDMNGPLGRLMESLPDLRDIFPENLPSLPELGGFHGVSLPHVSLPSVSGPNWGGGGPSWGGGGVGLGGMHALLWIVVLVVLGVVFWKVLHAPATSEEQARRWRLGPWPVSPAHVSTRGELILAFEYLAMKLLGPDARTRNHLDLAAEVGRRPSFDEVRQHHAAARLARLYEHARYAPPDEPLGESEMADARRDLCYLAGVAVV